MSKPIQIKLPPNLDKWVRDQAEKGFRSAPSVVAEAVAEKYKEAMEKSANESRTNA